MRKIIITLLILCISAINIKAQKDIILNADIVSIIIDENDFIEKHGVNFFVGELSLYLNSIGIECLVNKDISHISPCSKALYLVPLFDCQEYLKRNGMWVYIYKNISISYVNVCETKDRGSIYLGDIETKTTRTSL